MSDSNEVKWLREYAKKAGYTIDEEMTAKMKDALSDTKINLRVPTSLKDEIIKIAKKKNIPYQRYIKSILIDAVSRDKAS